MNPNDNEIQHRVEANLALVPWVVHRRFMWALGNHEFDDLVAQGNLGLFEAARRWDPSRTRFSTYATTYVWGYIMQYLRKVPNWDARTKRLIPTDSLDAPIGQTDRTRMDELAATPEPVHADDDGFEEMRERFWLAADCLDIDERNVLLLRLGEGMPEIQVAAVLGVTRQTVNARYRRACATVAFMIERDLRAA